MSIRIAVLLLIFVVTAPCQAQINLPAVISDGMVLQQKSAVPIWGWGQSGDAVSVSFAGQDIKGKVNNDGRWQVLLKPLPASSVGRPMVISVGEETISLKDVVVGEVWLAAGQSNMALTLQESSVKTLDAKDRPAAYYNKRELSKRFDPLIRQLKVPLATSYDKPKADFEGQWVKADSQKHKNGFSAVAYYFASSLRTELDVPVGILVCAWGAKRIQPFIPVSQYRKDPSLSKYYDDAMVRMKEKLAAYDPVAADARFKQIMVRWRKKVHEAEAAGKWPPRKPKMKLPQNDANFPGTIFNAMINPLVPYAIRGAIWYQGESNTKYPRVNVFDYAFYLKHLADGWRDQWGQGDFPLYYCQLAQFRTPPTEPVDSDGWVSVCNDMRKMLAYKNMGMAVLNDCGEVRDIHPRNKVDAGKRLALWALARQYGYEDLVYSGPIYQSHMIQGSKVSIKFDSVGEGLMTARKHLMQPAQEMAAPLKGFQICGTDRKWYWAKARIVSQDTVEVWHPEVAAPDEVRYAWAKNPAPANLYNKAGLPTSVFSTK